MCKCREGFFYPFSKQFNGFDGIKLEQHYSNRSPFENDDYDPKYKCKKCPKGCETCNGM